MNDPVTRFLELFGVLAGDAAQAWCGDREAIGKFFKGTSYGQRRKDWFPLDGQLLPRRAMRYADYAVLRQLLSGKNKTGQRLIAEASLQELDSAYAFYIAEMNRSDARRNRGIVGKTLYFGAAHERIERALSKKGANYNSLQKLDFVKQDLRRIVFSPVFAGDLNEAIRICQAFCLILEKQPGRLLQFEHARFVAAAICAITGQWAAYNSDDVNSVRMFTSYLRRLYPVFPDFAVLAQIQYHEDFGKSGLAAGEFRVFSNRDQIKTSEIYTNRSGTLTFLDAVKGAYRQGVRLKECTDLLSGSSPEQLLLHLLSEAEVNAVGAPDCAVAYSDAFPSICYGVMLANEHRFPEAWRALERAQHRIQQLNYAAGYLEFRLRQAEAFALRKEWKVTNIPSVLVACVRKVDEAIGIANRLRYVRCAQALREMSLG